MIRSVLLLSISAAIRSAAAFSVHGPVAPALRSASAAHATARRASALRPVATPALRMMADQPDQVIDFGKVGFTDAENQVPAPSSCATPCCAHQAGALLRRRCATPRRRACRGLAISQPRSAAKQAWVARPGHLLQAPPPILARPWTLLSLAGLFGSTSQHVLPLVAIRGRTQRKRDAGAFQPVCARILTPLFEQMRTLVFQPEGGEVCARFFVCKCLVAAREDVTTVLSVVEAGCDRYAYLCRLSLKAAAA